MKQQQQQQYLASILPAKAKRLLSSESSAKRASDKKKLRNMEKTSSAKSYTTENKNILFPHPSVRRIPSSHARRNRMLRFYTKVDQGVSFFSWKVERNKKKHRMRYKCKILKRVEKISTKRVCCRRKTKKIKNKWKENGCVLFRNIV